jgi:hypothetical protein
MRARTDKHAARPGDLWVVVRHNRHVIAGHVLGTRARNVELHVPARPFTTLVQLTVARYTHRNARVLIQAVAGH